MGSLKLNYNTAMFRTCLDTATSGRIVGRRLSAPIPFAGFVDLVLKADTVMDIQDYPRAFQRKRQFREPADTSLPCAETEEDMMDEAAVNSARGARATFLLHVISRQNACWQGAVITPEDDRRHPFDSVLQLLEILDTLLPAGQNP